MSKAGKTSIITRLCHGRDKPIPLPDERTIGVEINPRDPEHAYPMEEAKNPSHIDTRIEIDGIESLGSKENNDFKRSLVYGILPVRMPIM